MFLHLEGEIIFWNHLYLTANYAHKNQQMQKKTQTKIFVFLSVSVEYGT